MMHEEIKKYQPIAYRILHNALIRNNSAHAYLFCGEKGTPKKECAFLLAQSLLCQNVKEDGFACEECDDCKRLMHGNYADLIYVDGNLASIKKNDILKIQEQFSKTRLESRGKKVYILDGIENSTAVAMNALLKFLEEPEGDILAILICEHEDRVLETIVSRCQKVPFYKNNTVELFNALKEEMSEKDAYVLSKLATNLEEAKDMYESDEFQHATYLFERFVESKYECAKDPFVKVFLQNEGFSKSKRNDKQVFSLFLTMLNLVCRDIYKKSEEEIISIWGNSGKYMLELDVDKIIRLSIEMKDKIVRSVNIPLLVDQFMYEWEA